MSQKRGFTLIELLVVIAVIGILAASVIIGLSRAQTRARDAARKSDLGEVRKVLETYLIDNPSGYPSSAATVAQGTPVPLSSITSVPSNAKLLTVLDGVAMPTDPRNADGADWNYKYINNYTTNTPVTAPTWVVGSGTAIDTYTVYAHLESPKTAPAAGKAMWWHVNSKGASIEVQMATTGSTF